MNTTKANNENRKIVKITNSDGKPLNAQNSMKILGFTLNARASLDTHLSKMKSRIGMEYTKLKPYLNYMTQKDRKKIVNSKLRSILDYGLPLYMGEAEGIRSNLESTYMTLNRIIHGGLTFKVSKVNICKQIKAELPEKHILITVYS